MDDAELFARQPRELLGSCEQREHVVLVYRVCALQKIDPAVLVLAAQALEDDLALRFVDAARVPEGDTERFSIFVVHERHARTRDTGVHFVDGEEETGGGRRRGEERREGNGRGFTIAEGE